MPDPIRLTEVVGGNEPHIHKELSGALRGLDVYVATVIKFDYYVIVFDYYAYGCHSSTLCDGR